MVAVLFVVLLHKTYTFQTGPEFSHISKQGLEILLCVPVAALIWAARRWVLRRFQQRMAK